MMTQPTVETQDEILDSELAAVGVDVDEALSTYESDLAQIQAVQNVYAPPELQRRRGEAEDKLARRLDTIFGEVDTRAQQQLDAARRDLATWDGDPVERLSAADLQRAAALAPFVRESVASLPVTSLTAELQRRRLAGDRVALALWVRYAGPVLDEAQLAAAAQGHGLDRDGRALADELSLSQAALIDEATRKKIDQARNNERRALAFKAGVRQIKSRDPRYQADVRRRFGLS